MPPLPPSETSAGPAGAEPVRVARNAMATRFEMVLHGNRPVALRAAAEAALDEIDRLEAQLSLYLPASELSGINRHAAHHPVTVEPGLFNLLRRAREVHEQTQGAFDITIAPLMRCWGFMQDTGRWPDPEALEEARSCVGMHRVELDDANRTVRFQRPGVMLDLGSIGKGYALERAVEILHEAGVNSALIHGGTSTICALGCPPGADAWKVAIEPPSVAAAGRPFSIATPPANALQGRDAVLAVVPLRDESLSVSAVWGKGFEIDGRIYGHVIDPRSGAPAQGALLAALVLPSATDSDAFSTALLTLGSSGLDLLEKSNPQMRALVMTQSELPPGYTLHPLRLPLLNQA